MREVLILVGAGALAAWLALPLLARVAARGTDEPQSRLAALTLAFLLAAALLAAPWVRVGGHLPVLQALLIDPPRHIHPCALGCLTAGIAMFWLASAVLGGIGVAAGALRLRRLVRGGRAAPRGLQARVRRLAAEVAARPPRVVLVDGPGIPFVTGAFAPTLVLPAALLRSIDGRALGLLLRHELLHVARRDLVWGAVVAALRTLFALHPTARRLAREIALAREEAVDATIASGDVAAYAGLLVDIAALAGRRSLPAEAVAAVDPSALERRIARLLGAAARRRTRRHRLLAVAGLAFACVLVGPVVAFRDPSSACPRDHGPDPKPAFLLTLR